MFRKMQMQVCNDCQQQFRSEINELINVCIYVFEIENWKIAESHMCSAGHLSL